MIVGAVVGVLLASAPNVAGKTAITDPILLGAMWFVRPQSVFFLVPPVLHFAVGGGLRLLSQFARSLRPGNAALIAVGVNGAVTLVESGQGAGVMGVGWWVIGSGLSAILMLVGIAAAGSALGRRDSVRPTGNPQEG